MRRNIDKLASKVPSKFDLTFLTGKDLQVLQTPADIGSIPLDIKGMTHAEAQAWSLWIESHSWTFFVTFTTAYESTPKTMRRLNARFFDALNTYSRGTLKYFWVMEKHKHRGVHTHGLLSISGLTSESLSEELDAAWKVVINEYVRCAGKLEDHPYHRNSVTIFDNSKNAINYTLKYLNKDAQDWDFFVSCN